MTQGTTTFVVSPSQALSDTPLTITAAGLPARSRVTISAQVAEPDAADTWHAHAEFEADDQGNIDLTQQAPVDGSYATVDPNGLIWSLEPGTVSDRRRSIQRGLAPYHIEFTLSHNGETLAQRSIERLAIDPAVRIEKVRDGITANVFLPDGEGPFPTVLVLAGSGGGFPDGQSALLASHGYAAVSLAYFGVENLPTELVNIPIEYFDEAIHWIQQQPQLDSSRLTVFGTSRGGELALLLASLFPAIRGVVSYVPSAYLWGAVRADNDEDSGTDYPSWTYHGEPLPYVARVRNIDSAPDADGTVSLTPAFLRYLEDTDRAERAAIAVEKINGPVILLSGEDDALWPSSHFSAIVEQRLHDRGFDFRVESYAYPGTGHSVGQPYAPTTSNTGLHPVRGVVLNFGGSPAANAHAREDSWQRVLAFLQRQFGEHAHATASDAVETNA